MDTEMADEKDDGDEKKPLPDILSSITSKFTGKRGEGGDRSGESSKKEPLPFTEPDAPPNSVERTLETYEEDDDFLNTAGETEDLELF